LTIEDFFTKGFVHSKFDIDVVDMFKNDHFIDCNSKEADDQVISKEAQLKLDEIHLHVGKNIIEKVFSNFTYRRNGMWCGVDTGSAEWHNDFIDGDPFTSNLLIYLEDGEPYGNFIEVKNAFEEYVVVPKPNEYVWLNQNKKFMHRATHKSGPRRLLSFEFFIPDLV